MLRPEVVRELSCPAVGLAVSWMVLRNGVPCDSLQTVRRGFKRECWPFAKGKVVKSNAKAISLREQGNQFYKKTPNNLDRALELYNQSICVAEEGSEQLGMGYANRSAVFCKQQMYRECLQNIYLAKRNHYPDQMMNKLNEREKLCIKMLTDSMGNSHCGGNRTKHCSMKSCLEMSDDARGIRTSRDLSVGEMVLLEKPFLIVLESELAYQRCDYCGARNGLNLIPCKDCTSVMYCSEDCQEQAMQRYHQFECEIVDDLQLLFRGPKETRCFQLALRLFWLGVLLYLEDPDNFLHRCESPAELENYRDPFMLEPSDYVLHLFLEGSKQLATSEATLKCISQFLTVLMYATLVEENKSLAHRIEGTKANNTLCNLLLALVHQSGRLADQKVADITCFYPFSHLLRHSCAPTSERLFRELQSVVVLKRPVREGQEITIAYDENLISDRTTKAKRQEQCKEFRMVDCTCEGCKADYPMLEQIENDEQLATELQAILAETDEIHERSSLAAFLEQHDNVYPKRELAEAWKVYRKFVVNDI